MLRPERNRGPHLHQHKHNVHLITNNGNIVSRIKHRQLHVKIIIKINNVNNDHSNPWSSNITLWRISTLFSKDYLARLLKVLTDINLNCLKQCENSTRRQVWSKIWNKVWRRYLWKRRIAVLKFWRFEGWDFRVLALWEFVFLSNTSSYQSFNISP